MSNKTWRRIWCSILFVFVLVVGGGVLYYMQTTADEITGEEYLKKQNIHVDELEIYADNVDNVVALYLNGNIKEKDFLNHLVVFQQELALTAKI